MESKLTVQTLLVLWVMLTTSQAWRSFEIILEDSSLTFDERYVNMSIGISTNSLNETLLNVFVTVLEDLDNLTGHAIVTGTTVTNEQINFLNVKGNFCRFIVGRKDGTTKFFFEEMHKFGNILLECPLKKGPYYIQEFKIDPEIVPPYLPEASFEAMGLLYLNDTGDEKMVVKAILSGKIDKSLGLNKFKMYSLG